MNPFPATSLDDTDNERPSSTGGGGGEPTLPVSPSMNGATSTPANGARQSISWPGQQRLSDASPRDRKLEEGVDVFVFRESIAVAIWSLTVPVMALVLVRVMEKASQLELWQRHGDYRVGLAMLAWLLLRLMPTKLQTAGAPGFLFSQFWVLLRIHGTFDLYPNLGCRICEWRLGRIPERALVLAFIVHAIVPCVTWGFVSLFSQQCSLFHESSLYALQYSEDGNEQMRLNFFLREVLVNALFPVAIIAVPVMLKLNGYPEWLCILVLYPLYSLGVDSNARGSSLCPSAYMAQSILLWQFTFRDNWRLFAQLLGNLLAGLIMQNVFPDDRIS